ncbi:MAG: sugar transferase [Acidimicrobiia bacterium]|nr:sugar transferase [Acidimicrobiia bacterium]
MTDLVAALPAPARLPVAAEPTDRSALAQCAWIAAHRPRPFPPGASYHAVKRTIDVVIVLLVGVVALPVGLLCALVIKVDDPTGPVFFRQQRTGRGGKRITIHKFRSMCPDAEARKAELLALNLRNGPDFKVAHDPRITRVGWWLRKLSLDEIPQLWDVLAGRMTLVGPRPTSMGPEVYLPWQTERFDAMPGLTGLWQVGGRTSGSFDERIRLDISYCTRRSLRLDLAILLRTIPVVLLGRGSW